MISENQVFCPKNSLVKLNILVFLGRYLPGFMAGGPIRTLVNMVDRLGDDFQFKIITSDRDLNDTKPYSGIKRDDWNKVGKGEVFYISSGMKLIGGFKRILCSVEYDIIYLNSFFSPFFTIIPLLLRRLRLIPDKVVVMAPRGEFSDGALELKKTKKRLYILAANILGIYHGIVWQASSEYEESDIRRWFGEDAVVFIAPDLASSLLVTKGQAAKYKRKGSIKILFLSRISRKKNLDVALKLLENMKGKVQFDIYGPLEDKTYWAECKKIINTLSDNIQVHYCGMVGHDQVSGIMRNYDLFFLPTLGENFGHVILEALCAGCPILISDQTPWRGLEEKGVGWDLPLEEPDRFREKLQLSIDMENVEYLEWAERARRYGLQVSRDDKIVEMNKLLFLNSMGKGKKNNV